MASWFQKLRARRRLNQEIGFWYHPQYAAKGLAQTARVPGIEVARGEHILGALADEGLLRPKDVHPAPLATPAELTTVHPEDYLEKTTRPDALGRIFGLEGADVDVDPMLIAQRRQVGGTIAATRWVVRKPGRLAFNFGGGFHHAEPEQGGGFCVYNDVAIAIAKVRSEGFDAPIAIVDLDYHQGNGNIVTFLEDPGVFTYSIHGAVWTHVEATDDEQYLLPSGTNDGDYLATLERTLPSALEARKPGLLFYIAGTDVLEDDRLGEFALTRHGALRRDRFVVDVARRLGCAIVVTMAGGYSAQAWRSTCDFARWLLTDEVLVTESHEATLFEQYARIARELDPMELQRGEADFQITESDLHGDLTTGTYASSRILDYYTEHGIEFALERYGLLGRIAELGFAEPRLDMDLEDPQRQRVKVFATKDIEEHLLVDIVLGRARRDAPAGLEPADPLELLSIEWMMLQNPTEEFSLRHPQWPGQDHPGLGVGEPLMLMLFQGATRLGLDGVVHHPSRYHIAFISAAQFVFLDPVIEGRFEAIREGLSHLDLTEATWMMERQEVRWADDGSVVEWLPEDIVIPSSERLMNYLASPAYQDARERARNEAMARGVRIEPAEEAAP